MPGLDTRWRKSSFSGSNGGDCVEAASRDDAVLVRDSKQQGRGQIHRFVAADWRVFTDALKAAPPAHK
jgi:hypothetical protein